MAFCLPRCQQRSRLRAYLILLGCYAYLLFTSRENGNRRLTALGLLFIGLGMGAAGMYSQFPDPLGAAVRGLGHRYTWVPYAMVLTSISVASIVSVLRPTPPHKQEGRSPVQVVCQTRRSHRNRHSDSSCLAGISVMEHSSSTTDTGAANIPDENAGPEPD